MALHEQRRAVGSGRVAAWLPLLVGVAAIVLIVALFAIFGNVTPAPAWDITADPAGALPF